MNFTDQLVMCLSSVDTRLQSVSMELHSPVAYQHLRQLSIATALWLAAQVQQLLQSVTFSELDALT